MPFNAMKILKYVYFRFQVDVCSIQTGRCTDSHLKTGSFCIRQHTPKMSQSLAGRRKLLVIQAMLVPCVL